MRDSVDPARTAPMRRLAILGLVFVAAILSCGKDITGPLGAAARYVRGFSWNPEFPPAYQLAGGAASGVVSFNRVHVVLHHDDGTVALDTVIDFPAGADSLTVSLTVKLLDNAPATGEQMSLNLGYLDAAGDTVFKGGPISITAAPPPAGGGSNPPVQVPVAYTGPGASAVAVAISPRSATVVAGSGFSFSAIAKDNTGAALAGTPIVWNSLDPSVATITSPAAGSGIAQNVRGTARIIAQLLTGAADTVQLFVTLPASQLLAQSGNAQAGVVGTTLAQPLVVKVAASDGVGVSGTTVTFAVVTGAGSVTNSTAVSDANGLAQTTWKLGAATGAQSVTASSGTLANSPLTFTATAQAATATKLVVTTPPVNGVAGIALTPIVVAAEDNNGNIATTFTGPVTVAFGATTAGAVLAGTATVNAVAGVATFSTLTVNKNGTAYTLVASSTGLTSATTSAFDIALGAPSKLMFSVQPSLATANLAITPAIVVNAQDSQGNPTPLFTGAVTLAFATNPTGATLSGTAAQTAVGGVATFANITVSTAGVGYALSASATGLTSATSSLFNIGGGVATAIVVVSGGGQTSAPNTALAQPIVIQVNDAGANPVAGTTVNFAVLTGGGGVLPASGVSNAAGRVQTTWTLGATLGAQSISATSAGLTGSPLTINATASSALASKTWIGVTNNQWTTATNWSPAGVPAATDSILIPVSPNNPTLAATTTVADIVIQTGATLTIGSGASLNDNGTLDATGGILGTGNVVVNGLVPRNIKGTMTVGQFTMFGAYTQNGALLVVGNVLINSGGSHTMNGNPFTVTGNFSLGGTGTLTMNNVADVLTVAGAVTFGGASETGLLTNGTISLTGNFFQTNVATSFVASGAHQVIFAGAAAQAINMTSPGTSTFNKLTSTNSVGVTLLTNVVTASDFTTAGPVTGAFGLTIGGQLIDPLGGVSGGAISFLGAANPVSASTATINESVTFNSASTLLANLTINGGGININSASGSLTLNGHTLTSNGPFATANSGTLTMNNAADALTVNGNATFSGGVNNLSNGIITITGSFTQNTTTTSYTPTAAHKTRFTGVAPTITFANPLTSYFGRLEIASAPTSVYTFASDVQTTGAVWLQTGGVTSITNAGHTFSIGGSLYDSTGGRWQATNTVMFANSPAMPKTLATNLTFSGIVALTDSLKLTGGANAMTVNSGSLAPNGHKVVVTGPFSTSGTGVLIMTNASDSLIVHGNANFSGGSTTGQLTNGYLEVDGSNFFQGTNATAFAADAPHITWFWGSLAQTVAFANPGLAGASHFGNLYLQDTATVLNSAIFLNGELQTGGQSSFHVRAASDQLITSNGANLRNIVFDNVRWKLSGTNGNGLFPSLDNVIFQNISATTLPQFDYEYSVKTNLSLPGFTFLTTPTGGGSYVKIVGPDTLTFPGISPASNGGFVSLSGGGAINGWLNTTTWTGASSTAWTTAGNWSSGVVPAAAADVVIGSSSNQPTTSSAVTVHSLTVNGGTTLTVNGGNLTVSGLIDVQPSGQISLPNAYGIIAQGDVVTDTAGTTGITSCATGQALNIQSGAHNVTGKFCNLALFGNATVTGPLQVVGTGNAGSLQPESGGNLTLAGHRVDATQFWAQGTGTITMTNTADSLLLHGGATGTAYFMGGNETGLMTAGTLVIRGGFFDITGLGIDASGTHTTVLDTTGVTQQVSWSSPVANHGFNNLIVRTGTQVNVGTSTVTINGDLTMQPAALLTNNQNSQIVVAGNVSTDTAATAGVACSNTYGLNITGSGKTVKGRFCNLNVLGSYAASGPVVVSGSTFGEGELIVSGAGSNLTLNGNNVFTLGFETASSGTLTMTNAADTLSVHGNTLGALFNGGATTGLLTAGTIIARTSTITATGLGYDASGSHTLVVDTLSPAFQTLTFNGAVPGHGFNNVTMKNTANKGFSGEQWINGTLLFDVSMVGPGNVQGSYPIHVNTLIDNSSGISGGGFQGSAALHITGTTPFNRDTLVVNTLYIDHGQTFALAHNLVTNYMVVDSNSTLSLNGHTVNLQGNYFTTQNGGMLSMTNAADSLVASWFFFNGGSTSGLLTNGGINVTGPIAGVFYQGFASGHVAVPGASTTSFAPSGTRVWFNPAFGANVAFANPGSGGTGSHFWFVQAANGNPITMLSNVVVDSLLKGDVSGDTWQSDSAAQNITRTLLTAGIYNSGTFGLSLRAVYLFLNDGVATSSLNNVTWTNFPTVTSGALFTQNRTSAPPSINSLTYTGTSFSGTGQFVLNVGSSLLTLGSSITPSTCASGVYSNGQGCH